MAGEDFFWMPRCQMVSDSFPMLRDVRSPMIELDCRICRRQRAHDRKQLVKTYGASVSFAEIRRRMTVGCKRMHTDEGDKCGTYFPYLLKEQSSSTKAK